MSFAIDTKKITKNTFTLYIRQAITMLISFFTTRVTLKQLGVTDYGLNNLVGSIVSMFSFLNGSMGTAVQRYFSFEIGKNDKNQLKKVFGVGLLLHLCISIITLLIAEIFAVFFLEKMNIPIERMYAAKVVFQFSIITLVAGIFTVPYSALLRAREQFSATAIIDIVQAVLRLGVLYLLVIIDFDKLITLSFLNLIISLTGIISYVILAFRFEESHTLFVYDKILIREMLKFVSFLIITVFSSLANSQGIVMLINLFFGLVINAAYGVAVQVQNAVNNFITSFKASLVPQIMASYGADDLDSMHKLINSGTKITYLLLLLITLPLVFSINLVLKIWLVTPPDYAAPLVVLTLVSINISSFTYFLEQGIHASGKIMKQQLLLSCTFIGALVLLFILFNLGFSFYLAPIVSMIVGVIQCCVNIIYSSKNYQFSVKKFLLETLLPSLLVTVMSVGLFFVEKIVIINEVIELVVFICTSIFVLPVLGYFILLNKSEKIMVLSFIKSKILKKKGK